MMSRKDYLLLLAVVVKGYRLEIQRSQRSACRALEDLVYSFADEFTDTYKNFDKEKFLSTWQELTKK